MGSDSSPSSPPPPPPPPPTQKTLLGESINRGLVCAHMHSFARTQKILTFMSSTGECWQQKDTQHAPSTETERDYPIGWINKKVTYAKIAPKMLNPRDIAGERRRIRRRKKKNLSLQNSIFQNLGVSSSC